MRSFSTPMTVPVQPRGLYATHPTTLIGGCGEAAVRSRSFCPTSFCGPALCHRIPLGWGRLRAPMLDYRTALHKRVDVVTVEASAIRSITTAILSFVYFSTVTHRTMAHPGQRIVDLHF